MSLINFINKVQSVVTNFISDIKEKFAESDLGSIFDFGVKEDLKTEDVENLANEYLDIQAKVSKEETPQAEVVKEEAPQDNRMNGEQIDALNDLQKNSIENAGFPEGIKQQMSGLYDKLSDAKNINEANNITAQIQALTSLYEANGQFTEPYMGFTEDLIVNSLEIAQLNQQEILNAEMNKATDRETKIKYFEQMDQSNFEFNAEIYKHNQKAIIERAPSLNEDQKANLKHLYDDLSSAMDEAARNHIKAQIMQYCAEQNIQDGGLINHLDATASEANRFNKLAMYNEQKMNATTEQQKMMIDAVMWEENMISGIETETNQLLGTINSTNLPPHAKAEINRIISEYSNIGKDYNADTILAEITAKLAENNISTNTKEYASIEYFTRSIENEKQLTKMYNLLASAPDEATRQNLLAEIDTLHERSRDLSDIHWAKMEDFN